MPGIVVPALPRRLKWCARPGTADRVAQPGLEPPVRATVLSMTGQANSIGQAAGGPVFGVIGTAASLTTALVGSAGLLTPIVALYGRFGRERVPPRRRARRDP